MAIQIAQIDAGRTVRDYSPRRDMRSVARGERLRWIGYGTAAVIVAVGPVVAYVVTRPPGQPRMDAPALPVVGAARESVFVDCSKVDSVAYFPDNPCQTFVLIQSDHFRSASVFLDAEAHRLLTAGWRHPGSPPPVDYDAALSPAANVSQSWIAPRRQGCAYLATAGTGIAAEGKALTSFDPYDEPHGLLVFYRSAKATDTSRALWARLWPCAPSSRDGNSS